MKKQIKKSELRNFSLIWSFLFSVYAIYPLSKGEMLHKWVLLVALLFVLVAFIKPTILGGFYRIWVKIGELIGGVISKVIMFILYFIIFTPISFSLKILGKDLLNKRLDKTASTYWIDRDVQPQSMKNQF